MKRLSPKRPRSAVQVAVALGSPVVQEDLPLSFVHYPNLYGTFIGFSRTPTEKPVLCSCNEPAVRNYICLDSYSSGHRTPIRFAWPRLIPTTSPIPLRGTRWDTMMIPCSPCVSRSESAIAAR
jgi:hypothetical protein